MRIYIIGNDGITLCREPPTALNDGEIAVASNEELHAAPLSGKRLLALWNAFYDATACREALSRLPKLDLGELRQQWRSLYKADASPHLSRELLVRAVAYRMQEVALGGLPPEPQRRLRQVTQQFKETGEAR